MANILDALKGDGLKAAISALKFFAPKEFGDLIDKIQADVDGGMTLEKALATFASGVRAIETFTGPEWDAALESYIVTVNAVVNSVALTMAATNGK